MGTGVIFPGLLDVTDFKVCPSLLECSGGLRGSGKQRQRMDRPETDTGGLAEHAKALERTMPKELGKLLA